MKPKSASVEADIQQYLAEGADRMRELNEFLAADPGKETDPAKSRRLHFCRRCGADITGGPKYSRLCSECRRTS